VRWSLWLRAAALRHYGRWCLVPADAFMPDGHAIQTRFGADTFVVVEKWASLAHLKAHGAAPHMAAYAAKVKDLIAERVIHVTSPA